MFSVIYILSCHLFNQTNLTESMLKANTENEQHSSQLDNPTRECGVVSIKKVGTQWVLLSAAIKWNEISFHMAFQWDDT